MTKFKAFIVIIFLLIILMNSSIIGSENKQVNTKEIFISGYLKLGPIQSSLPLFNHITNLSGKEFTPRELLKFESVTVKNWWPHEGELFTWDNSTTLKWEKIIADSTGFITLSKAANKTIPHIIFLASYLDVRRWTKAKLEITSCHLFQVYLDGDMIISKTHSDSMKSDTVKTELGKSTYELKLETGKHLLLIKALRDPVNKEDWKIKTTLHLIEKSKEHDFNISIIPRHYMTIKHLLDGPKLTNVSISPDGELAAVSISQSLPPTDESESWLELRRVKDGRLLETFRGGMKVSTIQWAPTGKRFSYISSEKEERTLWIVDRDQGTTIPILKSIKNLSNHTWSPDGKFIIYSITEKPKPDKNGLKKLEGMPDRWPEWRYRNFLYLVNIPEGTNRRLTSGKLTTELNCISPDAKKLIFSRSVEDFSERPYTKTELFILDLSTMQFDSLWTGKWFNGVQWSPDGKKLLLTGGPSMFGGTGINIPEGMIPNDYDTQAYIYNLDNNVAEPITFNFKPTIAKAIWSKIENCIYFNTTDRSYRNLYRYDLKKKTFELLETGVEVLNDIDFADYNTCAVYSGSSAASPPKAYVMDLTEIKYRVLAYPEKHDFEDVTFGRVERWTFENKRGIEIEGRIYYPPDFNPNKEYPCIVNYYGGTGPVIRDFGGRYPKNLYAAQGYVVYVLQPSGAVGFGQDFSALHVNDWGIIVADEIIDGVKKFLAAHPFIDTKRVGCIGASYGGFMTMLIQTRTDMFAAAVAHAGISSISSYWGEGYWGYLYSTVATANSFPWNRKDIYIEQSPLFNADKVKTPILLLHGMSDTNVPPGESIQFYAALKLLGKEVELVQVEDQNHLILQYNKRIRWLKSILAWFDKWLKNESQWWEDLYPREK